MRKILWGVCGIGHGHIFRQLPLIEHFSKTSDITIFAYGESYEFFKGKYKTLRVAVPYFVGTPEGLDYKATAEHPANRQDFDAINEAAMEAVETPDLVISDYEPMSAQCAYMHGKPLITIDQQSKYLCGDFPAPLNGQNFIDEVQRLRLFFPRAKRRIACSFFDVKKNNDDVDIVAPVLNDKITSLRRTPDNKTILMYLSSQRPFGQSFEEIVAICQTLPDIQFHLFGKNIPAQGGNLSTYEHGDPRFHEILSTCGGIVSTAGHSLLSEAMYLGIPVYAAPLPLYEQEMNAQVIHDNGFGMKHAQLEAKSLATFINNIPHYTTNIAQDKKILLRGTGQQAIIDILNKF